MDLLCVFFCLVFAMPLCAPAYTCLVVTCWEWTDLLAPFVVSNCVFVTFPLVSWVRCGTWLNRFMIFALLLTFKINYRLMQVKSIAECSKGIILQYFRPLLSYHLSFRSLFCLFLNDRYTHVLLYIYLIHCLSINPFESRQYIKGYSRQYMYRKFYYGKP